MKYAGGSALIVVGTIGSIPKIFKKDWNISKSDHSGYIIPPICQNTKKGPRDLRSFDVTQAPEIGHQLTQG